MTPNPDQPNPDEPGTDLPRLPLSLVRAAAPWKRAATATTSLPESVSVLAGWRPDREKLAEYRTVVGSSAQVPLAFPQVPIMAMHMDLISRWSFPVRAMGLIHAGSVVEVLAELQADEPWDLRVWGSPGRHVRAGMEFDLWGEVSEGGAVRWRSRAVYLSRSRAASGAEESAVPELSGEGPWDAEVVLPVAEGTGRTFARVTGDVNPIHMYAATARAFGFRRAIAHGWWTTGRAAALLERDECVPGRSLEVAFRRPVELPSAPLLVSRSAAGVVEFAVVADGSGADDRPLVTGRLSD
jgi:hypothetical protein